MRKTARTALALVVLGALAFRLRAQQAAEAGVRQAIELYFQGHATGNGDFFRQAFHPEAKLFWIRDGQFAQRPVAEYIAGASGQPAADEARRRRRIVSLDVTGNTAMVKLTLDYPDALLTDYMALLKVNGEWKIVNKVFHRQAKPK